MEFCMKLARMALLLLGTVACTNVDETEHCIETQYGKIVNEHMSVGINATPITQATCFSLTDVNFPAGDTPEQLEAQTSDPVTLTSDLTITYAYDPATILAVFKAKRSSEAAELEIQNAIRSGYRSALASWSIKDIFSPARAALDDSVRSHIQRKLGNRAIIRQVFVRNLKVPASIEQARIAAAQQEQILDKAQKQSIIDSVTARSLVIKAQSEAEAKRLEAASYAANPALLQLEATKALANGLASVCAKSTTCIIGGSALDLYTPKRLP
jgi:hypothetical protein